MIKNDKYFIYPPNDDFDFKKLVRQMAREGAGRPVDKDGVPVGSWTPELLADAISHVESTGSGVELRTVQRWFQDNDQGIKTDNIRLLARVFGCGDPEATRLWRAKLAAAQSRLVVKRREKRNKVNPESSRALDTVGAGSINAETSKPAVAAQRNDVADRERGLSLAARTEALYTGQHPLTLSSVVWVGLTALAIMTFIFGVQSVTYRAVEGLDKQVGFLWAPSWTILPLAILPLFLVTVARLLSSWKAKWRSELKAASTVVGDDTDGWESKVASFSWLFWSITILSFGLLFLLQWSGVHLRVLLQGDASGYMMDWSIVAVVRPDVISVPAAIAVSMFAYIYFGMLMWFLFAGLVFLFAIANDFYEICGATELHSDEVHQCKVREVGARILEGVYRCTILAILFVTCIKLQSTYLLSNGETIVDWLVNDAQAALVGREPERFSLEQRGIPQFTSLLLLFVNCLIFSACFLQINAVLKRSPISAVTYGIETEQWKMIAVVLLLSVNLVLIGVFTGFSLLLAASLLVAFYSLYNPKLDQP